MSRQKMDYNGDSQEWILTHNLSQEPKLESSALESAAILTLMEMNKNREFKVYRSILNVFYVSLFSNICFLFHFLVHFEACTNIFVKDNYTSYFTLVAECNQRNRPSIIYMRFSLTMFSLSRNYL